MVTFPNDAVLAACRDYGPLLKVGTKAGVDPARVMLAIAAVESGGADPKFAGNNCGPRHEPAFDVGGSFYGRSAIQRQLVQQFGRDAASSFGPWQMMFCNFSNGLAPQRLNTDIELDAMEFVRYFNRQADRFDFTGLIDIGEVWNTGREIPDPDYTDKLARAYDLTAEALG